MEFTAIFKSVRDDGNAIDLDTTYFGTKDFIRLMILKNVDEENIKDINNFVPPLRGSHEMIIPFSVARNIKCFHDTDTVEILVPNKSLNTFASLIIDEDPSKTFDITKPGIFVWKIDDEALFNLWRDSGFDNILDVDQFNNSNLII